MGEIIEMLRIIVVVAMGVPLLLLSAVLAGVGWLADKASGGCAAAVMWLARIGGDS